jgi:hypothetical protein
MKTAMEELIKELYYIQELPMVSGIIKRAELLVEKEKEQIINAHLNGQSDHHFSLESRMAESEDYYNQTYNQNK